MGEHAAPRPEAVDDDAPLRLATAAAIAFPDGSMTERGLRREVARGRLAIERVAGKDYTTLADIRKMREQCRVKPSPPASGSSQPGETATETSSSDPSGSSAIAEESIALAAARMRAERLRSGSPNTSSPGTRPAKGVVIPIRS